MDDADDKPALIESIRNKFGNAVRREQVSLSCERATPYVMSLAVSTSLIINTVAINILDKTSHIWDTLPEQGRIIGVVALLAASTAPLIKRALKGENPIATKKEGLNSFYEKMPFAEKRQARTLYEALNTLPPKSSVKTKSSDHRNLFVENAITNAWDNLGETRTSQPVRSGLGLYYKDSYKKAWAHGIFAAITAINLSLNGDNLSDKFAAAFDWTPRPIPLEYYASIAPPPGIVGKTVATDLQIKEAARNQKTLIAHEDSKLEVKVYGRSAEIKVDGEVLEFIPHNDLGKKTSKNDYIYATQLPVGSFIVQIEDVMIPIRVEEDMAPKIEIYSAAPSLNRKENVEIIYSIEDDNYVTGASAKISIPGVGEKNGKTVLPMNQLPEEITIPY